MDKNPLEDFTLTVKPKFPPDEATILTRLKSTSPFDGKITDIRIYPYALSPDQIQTIYRTERLIYMKWYERLVYRCKVTIRIFLGRLYWGENRE